MTTAKRNTDSAKSVDDNASTGSTAVDLNAGHGTDRDASPTTKQTSTARGAAPAARSRRSDNTKAAPDGEGGGESDSAFETESLHDRSSRSDVEGGVG